MSAREENIRVRIEALSDLPTVADQLSELIRLTRQQQEITQQSALAARTGAIQQVTAIESVTDALKKQQAESDRAGKATSDSNDKISKSIEALSGQVRNFQSLIATAFTISEIKSFGMDIINAKTEVDSLKVSFDTMLGSKRATAELYGQIVQLAKETPFDLQTLSDEAKKLLAYNVSAADLIPTLTNLGNVAAAVGMDKLPQITLAYGQIMNMGRLLGTETRQLIEAGIDIYGLLSDSMGKTREQVIKMAADHTIMASDVKKAFEVASAEGGKYAGMMEQMSKTVGGQVSNLGDIFFQAKAKIGDFFENQIRSGTKTLGDLIEAIAGSESAIKRTITTVGAAVSAWIAARTALNLLTAQKLIDSGETDKLTLSQRILTVSTESMAAASATATGGLRALWAAFTANPLGALITLISLAASAWMTYDASTQAVISSLGEQQVKLEIEKSELNGLATAAINAAEGSKARKDSIQSLIEKYPEYFSGLDKEKTTNDQLRNILDKVNLSYAQRISLAREAYNVEQLNNQQQSYLEREKALLESLPDELKKLAGGTAAGLLSEMADEDVKKLVNNQRNLIKGLYSGTMEEELSAITTGLTKIEQARAASSIKVLNLTASSNTAEIVAIKTHYETLRDQADGNAQKLLKINQDEKKALANVNLTARTNEVKDLTDQAEKVKSVTLLSAKEIALIKKDNDQADELDRTKQLTEQLDFLNKQEAAEIESINKIKVNKKISASALAALQEEARQKILAIDARYNVERAKLLEEDRENFSRSLDVDISAIQQRTEGEKAYTTIRVASFKEVAKTAKETEKEIQDSRKETTKINEETSKLDEEVRKTTINSLVQMATQMGGIGGQLASFTIKAFADINLLSGAATKAAADNLSQAQFSLDTMTKMYGENDIRVAKQTEAVATANKQVSETANLTAGAVFQIIDLGQKVLQGFADAINAAGKARMQAIADGLKDTSASLTELYTLVRTGNKDALDAVLSDTKLSLADRQSAITGYYAEEHRMASNQQRVQVEIDFLQAKYQAAVAAGDNIKQYIDAVDAAEKVRIESNKQFAIDQIKSQHDEAIQLAGEVRDAQLHALQDELEAFKKAKQAETDALNEELARRKALEQQNSSDDQIRLTADDVFRKGLLDAGEKREVEALEKSRDRELARTTDAGERTRIINAYELLIKEKHAEYQTAIGDKSKETSLATTEVKARESDAVTALEKTTTAQINALKQLIADKDASVNAQMTAANAKYNEAVRSANYQEFSAKKELIVAELNAELASLRGRRAPASVINDLIAAINEITGQQNPYARDLTPQEQASTTNPNYQPIQDIIQAGKPAQIVGDPPRAVFTSSAYDKAHNVMTFTYNPTGKSVIAYDENGKVIIVQYADGFVPATGEKLYKGSPYVELGGAVRGVDTIPAMLTEGERVIPAVDNMAIGGRSLSNKELVNKVKYADLLIAQFPQYKMLAQMGYGQLQLPDWVMKDAGSNQADMAELTKAFKLMEQTFRQKELVSIRMDEAGFTKSIITQQSKINHMTSLFTR